MTKYKSCYWIDGGIDFRKDNISLCCFSWLQNYSEYLLQSEYYGGVANWEKIFEKKRGLRKIQSEGGVSDFCKGCIYQEEQEWYDGDFFYCLALNHYTVCNSRCIYCDCGNNDALRKEPYYDIAPVLKNMIDNGFLKSVVGSFVTFGGGEPTLLRDFDKIISYLSEANFSNIRINTSGIKYSETIERGLTDGLLNIVISPDSGSPNIYKKIKRVDCFDNVWENIEQYLQKAKNKKDVNVKYIIIPGINDTEEDFLDFYNQLIKTGVVSVGLTVEQNWASKNPEAFIQDKRVDKISDLFLFAEQKIKDFGFNLEIGADGINFLNNIKNLKIKNK
jgi:uncharacterized radical SAM superfamily Fe-S cluster-containing enzyme